MSQLRYLPLIITSFFTTSAIADMVYTAQGAFPLESKEGKQLVQAIQAAEPVDTSRNVQIFSENAVGQSQKTIVDQNGNLRVVEKLVETPAQTQPAAPVESGQSSGQPSPAPNTPASSVQNEQPPANPNTNNPTLEQQQREQQQQVPPPNQMQPGQMQSGQPQPSQMQPSQMQSSPMPQGQVPGQILPSSQSPQMQPSQTQPAQSQPIQPQGGQPR